MDSRPNAIELKRFAAPTRIDAGLVEEAVLLAVDCAPVDVRGSFFAARNPIYELPDSQKREARFFELHAAWFERLELADPLLELLAEQPTIGPAIAACLIAPAARRKDEHADLREARSGDGSAARVEGARSGGTRVRDRATPIDRPVLVIQLLASTLIDRARLERLLRRDLTYAADMIDPAFGYDPELAVRETSGPLASLLRERHELLWRVSVDGRLAARGYLSEVEAVKLRSRFESAFPTLGGSGELNFDALFCGPRPSHREMIELVRNPAGEAIGSGGSCPLCKMPTTRDDLRMATLSTPTIAAVQRDFADWRPGDGLCPHCADLYELRHRAGVGA